MYREAIIFLMVIPDFNGMEMLVGEMVEYRKKRSSY
jgi:hypothetical protein